MRIVTWFRVLVGLGGVVAAMSIAVALAYLITDESDGLGVKVAVSTPLLLAAGLMPVALWALERWPFRGSVLVVLASIPLGLLLWWSVFTPVLALLVMFLGIGRARAVARAHKEYRPGWTRLEA